LLSTAPNRGSSAGPAGAAASVAGVGAAGAATSTDGTAAGGASLDADGCPLPASCATTAGASSSNIANRILLICRFAVEFNLLGCRPTAPSDRPSDSSPDFLASGAASDRALPQHSIRFSWPMPKSHRQMLRRPQALLASNQSRLVGAVQVRTSLTRDQYRGRSMGANCSGRDVGFSNPILRCRAPVGAVAICQSAQEATCTDPTDFRR